MYGRLLLIQVLSIAVVVINHFIDNLITGACLGVTAMSSSGIISQASLVPAAFSGVVSMGLYSVCSRHMGAKSFVLGSKTLSAALALVTIVYVPLIIILEVFSYPLCELLCQDADAGFVLSTSQYTQGLAPSLYFAAVVPYVMYACQMNRKARWCSVAVGTLFVVNVGGDLFVALCTDLGMLGIGLCTSLSALAAMLILIGPALGRSSSLHLRWGMNAREFGAISWEMISFGLPSAVTTLANAFAGIWVNSLLISMGDYTAVAAYTCAYSVVNLLYMPASSLWYCTSIVTSVLLGKDMHAAIRRLPQVFTKVAVAITALPFLLVFVVAEPLCGLFIPEQPEVLSLAVVCTCVLGFNLLPNALITCFQSLFRSTGHRIAAVVLPAIYLVGLLPLLSWPLAGLLGAPGVCVGRVGAYCLGLIGLAVVCGILKKASPFKASTYVFLPPLGPGCTESDCAIAETGQIEQVLASTAGFFAKAPGSNGPATTADAATSLDDAQTSLGNAPSACALVDATGTTLESLLASGTRDRCWVHAAVKDGKPWAQITCASKTLNEKFAEGLDLDGVNASYAHFCMLGAVELYAGDAPYGAPHDKE